MSFKVGLSVYVLLSFFDVACKEEGRTFQKNRLDGMLGRFAQSEFVDRENKRLARSYGESQRIDVQDVCEKLKELGRKAQIAVGVPQERIVPIKQKASEEADEYSTAGLDCIIVNSDNEMTDGVSRCILYHEAVHIKYRDSATHHLIVKYATLGAFWVSGFATVVVCKPKRWWKLLCPVAAFFAGKIAQHFVGTSYSRYVERRADVEGYYATECYRCVYEKAEKDRSYLLQLVPSIQNSKESTCCPDPKLTDEKKAKIRAMLDPMISRLGCLTDEQKEAKAIVILDSMTRNSKLGYLSVSETLQIADDLKQENKLCELHKES